MSLNNLLQPNDYDLFSGSLTSPDFVKTNSIDTTDPGRLLIGSNESTFDGLDFGTLGSEATYTFNGIPFDPSESGVIGVAAPVDATDANVLQIVGDNIRAEYTNGALPGVVSTTAQTFGGNKTFIGTTTLAAIKSTGISADPGGTQRTVVIDTVTGNLGSIVPSSGGVTTLAGIGAIGNANGASIFGNTLNLQPATSSFGGVLTATGQTIAGTKTFVDNIIANGVATTTNVVLPASVANTNGCIQQPGGTTIFHTRGSNSLFLGANAGGTLSGTSGVVGIGRNSMQNCTGSSNVALGNDSGTALTSGSSNVFLGNQAGQTVTTGTANVIIGSGAGTGTTTQNSVIIGFASAIGQGNLVSTYIIGDCAPATLASYDLWLGASSTQRVRIRGIASTTVTGANQMVVMNSSTHQLGTVAYLDEVINFTPIIDSGTILTGRLRANVPGPGTICPISVTKQGKTVTLTIPAYEVVTASGGGAASTLTFTGVSGLPASYYPIYNSSWPCIVDHGLTFSNGTIFIAGGVVTLQLSSGGTFNYPIGFLYDFTVSYITSS